MSSGASGQNQGGTGTCGIFLILILFVPLIAIFPKAGTALLILLVVLVLVEMVQRNRRSEARSDTATEKAPKVASRIRVSKVLDEIDEVDGHEFETMVANLLSQNGFSSVSITPGSGDNGIDVIAEKDGQKYGFQCKRFSGGVGNHAVQEVFTGKRFYRLDRAIVITNAYFTPSAQLTAKKTGVELWDRNDLEALIEASTCESPRVDPATSATAENETAEPPSGSIKCDNCGAHGLVEDGDYFVCTYCDSRFRKKRDEWRKKYGEEK